MPSAKHQPAAAPDLAWHPIDTVPAEPIRAWIRWHDDSTGITSLAFGRDGIWWGTHGATHWRPLTEAEAAAYHGARLQPAG